jgi:hypothetical protein
MTDISKLNQKQYNDTIVLTTKELAEFYGVDTKIISYNFNRNNEKYIENIDYLIISFSDNSYREFQDNKNGKRPIYLWTESGALKHAKSIGTPEAWDVYNKLVKSYFKLKEIQEKQIERPDLSNIYALQACVNKLVEHEENMLKLQEDVNSIKQVQEENENTFNELPLSHDNANELTTRSKINLIVRTYAQTKYLSMHDTWKKLYLQFKYRYHFDVYARERKQKETGKLTKLDIIDQNGKLKDLYDLASELFGKENR